MKKIITIIGITVCMLASPLLAMDMDAYRQLKCDLKHKENMTGVYECGSKTVRIDTVKHVGLDFPNPSTMLQIQ
jgi:hypothetical protein